MLLSPTQASHPTHSPGGDLAYFEIYTEEGRCDSKYVLLYYTIGVKNNTKFAKCLPPIFARNSGRANAWGRRSTSIVTWLRPPPSETSGCAHAWKIRSTSIGTWLRKQKILVFFKLHQIYISFIQDNIKRTFIVSKLLSHS